MNRWTMLVSLTLLVCSAQILQAADIRLKNKAKVEGDVARVEDDYVYLRVPRQSIATVNGEALPAPLAEGVQAPAFSVTDIAGATQAVGQGQGHVTVLHFWVQWCPHCRSDAPKIQALYDQYRDNPAVKIVTVNLDQKRADVDAFVKEHRINYPVIAAAEQASKPDGANLPELYQINAFPVTYLIDAQGVIRQKFRGSFSESGVDLAVLVTQLTSTGAGS